MNVAFHFKRVLHVNLSGGPSRPLLSSYMYQITAYQITEMKKYMVENKRFTPAPASLLNNFALHEHRLFHLLRLFPPQRHFPTPEQFQRPHYDALPLSTFPSNILGRWH